VEHLELRGSVLTGVHKDGLLAARVIVQEVSNLSCMNVNKEIHRIEVSHHTSHSKYVMI